MKNPFHKLVRPSSKKSILRSKRKLRSIITPNVSKKLKADETNATTWSDEVEGDAPAQSISTTSVGEEAESVGISETDLYERLIRAEARVQAFEQQSNFQATQATAAPLVMKPSPPRFDQISPSSDGRTDYSKLRAAVEALQATLEKAPTEPIPADWKASILQASSSTERDRFRSFLAKEVTWAYAIDYISNRFQPAKSRPAAKVMALKVLPTPGESISNYTSRFISGIQPLWQDDLRDSGAIMLVLQSLVDNCTSPYQLAPQQAEILSLRAENLAVHSTDLDPLFTFQAELEKVVGSRVPNPPLPTPSAPPTHRVMLSSLGKLNEPCLNFQAGRCRYGDSCRRQHIPSPEIQQGTSISSTRSPEICLNFQHGRCYNADCKRVHGQYCNDFQKGLCHRARCKFLHLRAPVTYGDARQAVAHANAAGPSGNA
jgi:hypothetical protein